MTKIGVDVEAQDGMTWEQWHRLATRVEELGYESLWRSDHLFSVACHPERPALEAWTSLAYLATATSRIRFGTLVTPMTFRHPSVLAVQAAAIDELSGGRLEIGLGAGWNEREHEAFGIELPPLRKRFDRLDEGIAVMKALWSGEEATVDGRYFQLRGAVGHPRPAQAPHPPLVIGGTGEKLALRAVAKHADDWNAHGVTLEVHQAKRKVLERHCEELGRDPGTIELSIAGSLAIGETDAGVERAIRAYAEFFPLRTPQFFPEGAPTTVAALRERGWFVGRPDQIVEQIQEIAATGVHRVMVQVMPHDLPTIELFAEAVLPQVASHRTVAH